MKRVLTVSALATIEAARALPFVEIQPEVCETKRVGWSKRRTELQFYADVQAWRKDSRYPQREIQRMVPDTVNDSSRKRKRVAKKARGRINQIEALVQVYGVAQHIVIPLPEITGRPYYVSATVKAMSDYGRSYLKKIDSYGIVCLRWSRTGLPHLHIVARGDLIVSEYSKKVQSSIKDITRLAEYLSTPVDEAATKIDWNAYLNYTTDELGMQRDEAATRWLRAYNSTEGKRLPRTSFHTLPGYLLL